MEIKNDFEFLTDEENKMLDREWKRWKEIYDKKLLTRVECGYHFQVWVTRNFTEEKTYLICTNREEF